MICLFRAALPQNWRFTCMFATTWTLLLELSCLHTFLVLYGLRIISFDENSFNAPTTNNLNRTFLLVHYPFFNILKLVLRKAVLGYIYTGIHTGIHTGTSTSMHICHGIITSILCSKTFWLVSWLYYCFTALRHILGHFERGRSS